MALSEPIKKGGRYTKKEQMERRQLVHQMYFDEKKSAVQISKDLNINRNTINEDIKFWYSQLSNQSEVFDINTKMIKHIQRMEIRRDRLIDDLDSFDSFEEKMKIERLISELDDKLMQFYSKAIFSGKHTLPASLKPSEIEDEELKEIIRSLVLSDEVVTGD